MTEKELVAKFTPPDPKLAALRVAYVKKLEDIITKTNHQVLSELSVDKRKERRQWLDGLVCALYEFKNMVDAEGKILKEDLDQ